MRRHRGTMERRWEFYWLLPSAMAPFSHHPRRNHQGRTMFTLRTYTSISILLHIHGWSIVQYSVQSSSLRVSDHCRWQVSEPHEGNMRLFHLFSFFVHSATGAGWLHLVAQHGDLIIAADACWFNIYKKRVYDISRLYLAFQSLSQMCQLFTFVESWWSTNFHTIVILWGTATCLRTHSKSDVVISTFT